MRGRTGAAIGAAAVVLVVAGVAGFTHHGGSSGGGSVPAAVCAKSLGYLNGVSTAVEYFETQQVQGMANDAEVTVVDAGNNGSKLANDLNTLVDDATAWESNPEGGPGQANVTTDLKTVYADCNQVYGS